MSMDKSEIIKMVLELYSARKEAKEYLDFYAEPNEGQKLEEYKHIIRDKRLGELLQICVLEGGVLQARPHNLPPTEEMVDKKTP